MIVKQKHFNKRHKVGMTRVTFDRYKTDCEKLNKKLDDYAEDLNNGFDFYKANVLEKFIQGSDEIDDFAYQFLLLDKYNRTAESKYANTLEKFTINYGGTIGAMTYQLRKDSRKGSNNPAYNHGGRLSPWSDKSEVHSKEVRDIAKAKIGETKKNNPAKRGNTNKYYYIDKGYSEKEAAEMVKKRQATGGGWFAKKLKYEDGFAESPCILYFIKIEGIDIWKIGITSQMSTRARFGNTIKYNTISIIEGTCLEMFRLEQKILKSYKKYRCSYKTDKFSSTECFNNNILMRQHEII